MLLLSLLLFCCVCFLCCVAIVLFSCCCFSCFILVVLLYCLCWCDVVYCFGACVVGMFLWLFYIAVDVVIVVVSLIVVMLVLLCCGLVLLLSFLWLQLLCCY